LLTSDYIERYYRRTFSAAELAIDPQPALDELQQTCRGARRIFLDVDCDVLDPVAFPAVAQPVPFGLNPLLLLRLLDAIWSPNVAGFMLSEFDPGRDRNDQSLAMLMWLIEYLLLRRHEPQ
jgi:arginase family enzyme